MKIENKILKINRHLYKWGLQMIQGIAEQASRGSTPRVHWLQIAFGYAPACHADKGKMKDRAEILKLDLGLQNKRYRLIYKSDLICFPPILVFFIFIFEILKT
jgi:hypothetical protein